MTEDEELSIYHYTCTKQYYNLPCAHRQHAHQGACSFIHGYSRSFKFYFACKELDENHFVFDFGKLRELKDELEFMCDHTLLINEEDPELKLFQDMNKKGLCRLRIVKNCGAEGMAKYFLDFADELVMRKSDGRAWCYKVTQWENDKNSGAAERGYALSTEKIT